MKYLTSLFFLITIGCASGGRKPNMKTGMYSEHVPAIALRKIVLGDLVLTKNEGLRSVDMDAVVTANDKWHIGSCTKNMTSYLIAMLIQENKLQLDTSIQKIFPEMKFKFHQPVTIRQLLTHRSGLKEVTDIQPFWTNSFTSKEKSSQQRLNFIKLLFNNDLNFNPDEKYEYSNAGYIVLGAVIEKITAKSWEDVIQKKIFATLNMKSCGFSTAASADISPPDQPLGHIVIGDKLTSVRHLANESIPSDNPKFLGPAGTVHCSMDDWGRFLQEMLSASKGQSSLLRPEVSKIFFSEYKDQMAVGGWSYVNSAKGLRYTMAGSNTMNHAMYIVAPEVNSIYFGAVNSGTEEAQAELINQLKILIQSH